MPWDEGQRMKPKDMDRSVGCLDYLCIFHSMYHDMTGTALRI